MMKPATKFLVALVALFGWASISIASTPVNFTSPPTNGTVSGTVNITCTDPVSNSAWVNIGIDGNVVVYGNTPTVTYSWVTTKFANGAHNLTCDGWHWTPSNPDVHDGTIGETVTVANGVPTPTPTATATATPTATATATATPTATPTPAPTMNYVDNSSSSNCSDSGPGTQAQPWCTVAHAMSQLPLLNQGSEILFKCGDTWSESVTVSSWGPKCSP